MKGKTKIGSESEYLIAEPPATKGWEDLREAARGCRACPLWREATQTVFGEGPHFAKMMLVGEQPGDAEDRGGGPFVGPAEKLLDKALEEAGVNRASVYLTNVVKHFKWSAGNTGFFKSQTAAVLLPAARGWKLSCTSFNRSTKGAGLYGATAASAIFGPSVRILRDRGQLRASSFVRKTLIIFHTSVFLRATDKSRATSNIATLLTTCVSPSDACLDP